MTTLAEGIRTMVGLLKNAGSWAGHAVVALFWLILRSFPFLVDVVYEALRKVCEGQRGKVEATTKERSKADPATSRPHLIVGKNDCEEHTEQPSAPRKSFHMERPSTPPPKDFQTNFQWEGHWQEAAGYSHRPVPTTSASHSVEEWSIKPPFALNGHPSFVGVPYDPSSVPWEAIVHPQNCKFNRPLTKWYSVGYGGCQGIWRTWAEADRLVKGVSKQDHKSFKTEEEVEQWLTRVVQEYGVLPSLHWQNVKILGRDYHQHQVFFLSVLWRGFL